MKRFFLAMFCMVLFWNVDLCMAQKSNAPQLIIFDTDMGNDVDDAMALDLLYKYADQGKIKLLAIMCNKAGEYPARYLDIMNTWYGYPQTPIGILNNKENQKIDVNYTTKVCQMNAFQTTIKDVTKLPFAEDLYRQILSRQADHSVVIISTGFSTNLAHLLATGPDKTSNLTGRQLLAKKVKYLSVMAGGFDKKRKEFNVIRDIPSCAKMFEECDVPIVVSPFELGEATQYPGKSIEEDFNWVEKHPMAEAYKVYLKMPYDRPTWDVTSVLEVLEPGKFMTRSKMGNIFVDAEGYTYFTPSMDGKHCYLTATPEQSKKIIDYFLKILPQKPKNRR